MKPRIDWNFAAECDGAASIAELQALLVKQLQALGFTYIACCSHVDPLNVPTGGVMLLHYPQSWTEHFHNSGYARIDPIFCAARTQLLPFGWTDPRLRRRLTDLQLQILNEAAEAGLGRGFTIPIHAPNALPASCSLAIGPEGIDPARVFEAQLFAVYAHEAARHMLIQEAPQMRRPRLSARERQCIELAARGKDDYTIGVLLGISDRTAHHAITNAMHKYKVNTRVQVLVQALRSGEIRFEDIVE